MIVSFERLLENGSLEAEKGIVIRTECVPKHVYAHGDVFYEHVTSLVKIPSVPSKIRLRFDVIVGVSSRTSPALERPHESDSNIQGHFRRSTHQSGALPCCLTAERRVNARVRRALPLL